MNGTTQPKGNDGSESHEINPADVDVDDTLSTRMSRRQMMITTGAAAGAIAMGAGTAAAQSGETVDFSYEYVQNPHIAGESTVAEHTSSMTELQWINDNGEEAHLNDEGVVLADREDENTIHNPVTLRADRLQTEEYTAFPRGETYDDDGDSSTDEADIRAVDATHWSTDSSGSTGSITLENADEDALSVSTTGQASGDVATARFSDFSIDSGTSRKFLQAVLDVVTVESGATVEFRVEDSNGSVVTASVDPSGDTSNVGTIATATGSGKVAQERVGELEEEQSSTLADIVALEIAFLDANADLTIHGLNLEKESRWSFGSQEFKNSDDEIETETVREPNGEFSITSLSTLGDDFADATIYDVTYDVEQQASELPLDATMVRREETDRYDRPVLLDVVHTFEWPTGYDITSDLQALEDVIQLGSSRYLGVEVATGTEIEDWEDVDDNVTWTDRTSLYSGNVESDVELLANVSPGEKVHVHYELNLDEQTADSYTMASGGAAGGTGGGGFGVATIIGGLLAGLGGWWLWARRQASKATNNLPGQ